MSIGPVREAPRTISPAAGIPTTGASPQRTPAPATTPIGATPATAGTPATAATAERSPFARLVHGLGHEVTRGEATMRAALRAPADLGPSELLALQAGVYRYSEAVDLAAKLVDRATSGVKTVIQGQ